MSKKIKFYHVYGKAVDANGDNHYVTVVGKLEQTRKKTEVKEEVDVETHFDSFVKGELRYNVKLLNRKLTLGVAICHPSDTFDEELGVEIAKKRIEQGLTLGSIETHCVTMLTEDAIFAELMTKLNHIVENLNDYLPSNLD